MRIIFVLLALAGVLLLTIPVSAEYVQLCPFSDEPAELAIGGTSIDASWATRASVQEGVVLSSLNLWQQAGEGGETPTTDSVIEGQGLSQTFNGQGSWDYQAGWNVTGSSIDNDQVLQVQAGRLNPSNDQFMMSYVCPPSADSPYTDNLTHVIGAETAFSSSYADILHAGGYATRGTIGPGALTSDVVMVGQGLISRSGGYNAQAGIATNKTVDVITYVLQGKVMVPVVTQEQQTVAVQVGHTTMHAWEIYSGQSVDYGNSFRFVFTRAAPY
jgi:hypothetical protein